MYMSVGVNVALAWAKIGDVGILYLPICAYYFVIVLLNIDCGIYKRVLNVACILSIPVLILSQTNLCFYGMRIYNWGHYPLAGPLYVLLILFFSLFMACIPMLYYASKNTSNYNQSKLLQIKYVLFAFIGACTGFVDYLPKYNIPIYPWGHISVLVFISIITFAILKHHLMDINIVLRKGLIYSVLIGSITGLYVAFLSFSNQLISKGSISMPFVLPLSAVPTLVSAMALVIMGVIAFYKGIDRATGRSLFYVCLFTLWWQLNWIIVYTFKGALNIPFMMKLGYTGIIFIPISFVHFMLNFSKYKYKETAIRAIYSIGALFVAILWLTNALIDGYYSNKFGEYPKASFLHPIFLAIVFLTVSFGLYQLIRALIKIKDATEKKQAQLILTAAIFYVFASTDFLVNYGVEFYPPGYIFIITSLSILLYALFRYNLMDISIIVRKGLFYSMFLGLISGAYLASVYLFSYLIKNVSEAFSFVFSSILIIILAIIFQPLRDKVQDVIDKVFFRGKYDYQKTIKELSLASRSIADLDELLDQVLTSIVNVIHIKNASVYILDKRGGKYFARRTLGINAKKAIPDNDQIIRPLQLKKEAIIYDGSLKDNEDIERFMKETKAAIIFPIITKDELVGFLCLGEKLSGEVYSDEDIDLLSTLCNQIGVSIENAMLYEDALEAQKKLYQADKLATVGALAAGLAHEIKNPIAAIKGFSQVIDKAVIDKDSEAIKDFQEVVPRQLDRINEIVEKLLTLSKPPKMEKKQVDVNLLIADIVRLVEKQAMKQHVEIVKCFGELPQTLADPEQLTQAFLNLILNAIQSMPDGGQVEIRTRIAGPDKIELEFIDNGAGIPKEKLPKIFDPFFTTKTGGSGLGLSVTRQIVIGHHGTIDVESETGKGTKFKLAIPVK